MTDYIDKMVAEKRELDEMRDRLHDFLDTKTFAALPWQEQELMDAQLTAMTMYSVVLASRIEAATLREAACH